MSLEDEITQLLHDKELKAHVAAMKPEAKAKFAEVLDIVKGREFWRTAQCLVELSTPAMNLLRLADSDIPGTGKVYHEMFKTSKILESMSKSAEYNYIPKATHDAISAKWLQRWTDLHNPLHGAGYCLDPEFHSHDHSSSAEALSDLFCMCDKVHGAGSAASAKAQLDWSCAYRAKVGNLQKETVLAKAIKMQ